MAQEKVVMKMKAPKKSRKGPKPAKAQGGKKPKNKAPRAPTLGSAGQSAVRLNQAPTKLGISLNTYAGDPVKKTEVYSGRDIIGPGLISASNSASVTGNLLNWGTANAGNWDFNPGDSTIFGTRLTLVASAYEFYQIKKLKFTYAPLKGTSIDGQVGLAWDYDTNGITPQPSSDALRAYGSLRHNVVGPVWSPLELNVDCSANNFAVKKFYTEPARSSDPRDSYCGQLYAYNAGIIPNSTVCGNLYCDYVIEFSEPNYTAPAQAVGIQTSGFAFPAGGGTNVNPLSAVNTTLSNPQGSQIVTAPDGSLAIFLPPGNYIADLSSTQAWGTSNSALTHSFANSTLIPAATSISGSASSITRRRAESSTIGLSGAAGAVAATVAELITVPFGGAYYRPLLNGGITVAPAASTITFNLNKIISSLLGFVSQYFALTELEKEDAKIKEHWMKAMVPDYKGSTALLEAALAEDRARYGPILQLSPGTLPLPVKEGRSGSIGRSDCPAHKSGMCQVPGCTSMHF